MTALERIEAVAAEAETWCGPRSMTHHEWCGCQIARRLREALSDLRAREEFVVKAETCFGRVEDELDYTDEFNAAHRAYTAWRRGR